MKLQKLCTILLLACLPATAKETPAATPDAPKTQANATKEETSTLEALNKLAEERLKQETT
ncbi:MAG: hypothetical protein NWQ16_11305, partial [Akkermansiaceae bacterium]|nr:hypothetical protein [Akkermansiaceae bacterium]